MRKLLLLFLCVTAMFNAGYAQDKTITGKVTDVQGNGLPGASIRIKGTATGTTSNDNGMFTASVPANARYITVTSQGYIGQEIALGKASYFDVTLTIGNTSLEEVVVTGYQSVRKRDVASAISKISSDDIENLPMANFAQAMQGRAAGVAISAANGVPGGSLSVIIRGVGSITAGSTPLYVVDGIQLNTSTGSINTQNNPLNFLNPDDIESIEVLKDAAAASIYGARAGNGVVIVTTKKGKSGKPKITFNTFWGQSSTLRMLDVLNTQEWYNVRYEAIANATPTATPATIRSTVLSNLGLAATTTTGKVDSLPTYDWQDEAFGKGSISNMELSINGGSQNISYYLSGSYSKQTSFIKPTDFKRAAMLSKVSFKLNERLTLDNSISLSSVNQNAPYSLGSTGFGNPAYAAAQILTINPYFNEDGTYYGLPGSGQSIVGTFNHNIFAVGEYVKYKTRTNQLIGSAALTYKVIDDLTLRTFVGLDYRLTQDHRYQDPRVNDAFAVNGRLGEQSDWNTNFISTTTANYQHTFNDVHNVNGLAGLEYRSDENQWFQADGQGFPSYLLEYLSSASTPSNVTGQYSKSATFSQFAKLGYTYQGKYIFNYTVRRDGSSRFGTNNQYGVFQSAQVAWNVRDEMFLRDLAFLTDLKLRYSFGQAGNDQIGNVLFRQLYGASRIYGGASAINPTQLGNPDLSWETREENNLGLDLALFNNRLSLTMDAYRKINKDLLLSRSLYGTTGFTSITQNLGAIENKGLEILLSGKPLDGDLKWNTSFNIAFQSNKILELYDGLKALPSDASIEVGQPLGSFFLAEWAGVNPATGRGMWYDKDGNITYNHTTADRKFLGSIYPKYFGGWNNTISYHNFSLDAFFQYEYGRKRIDGQYQQMMRMGGATVNQLKEGYDARWRQPGDIAEAPRPFNGLADFNSVGWGTGSRYLFKSDYIRLKQITLSYNLQSSSARRYLMDGIRFYVQGINLWTYTKWQGYDPEFTGDNFGIIPQSKNITAGVQVRF